MTERRPTESGTKTGTHGNPSPVDAEIRAVTGSLGREIRKDLPFFGTCGLLVGWLMVAQARLKEGGIGPKDSWADALFSDFVSFNAFGLVFLGLLALGALATCLAALDIRWPRLEQMVEHLEGRLTQLASSIIAFTLGLSGIAFLHSGLTLSSGGALLTAMILLFNCLLVVGFGSATLVARRKPPFDRWWIGLAFLTLAIGAVLVFIFRGIK